jgi:hypothetical protein
MNKLGRTVIESETEPALEQMLTAFDPVKHSGELMAGGLRGAKALETPTNRQISTLHLGSNAPGLNR